jgi:hypothetical protein
MPEQNPWETDYVDDIVNGRPVPMAEPPVAPSFSFLDYASPAARAVLANMAPAVQPGRKHELANVLSALGQVYFGGRAAQAQHKNEGYNRQLAVAQRRNEHVARFKEQAALRRIPQAREQNPAADNNAYVDVTDSPELQKRLSERGALIPTPNSSGRIMVPASFLGPKDPLVAQRRSQIIEAAEALGGISPKAMRFWAERSASMGGELPPGLSRNPAMLRAFLENTASEAEKTGMSGYDMAARRAEFRAEAAALSDVTRTAERAKPFANLLHKNIGVLRGTMQGIKDTGTLFGNRAVRSIVMQMGDKEQARFNTALVPVAKEAARLLESTNLTGTLSVDAQKELRAILSNSFTLPQLEGALEIIEAETNNRIQAYEEAKGAIKDNLVPGAEPDTPIKGNEAGASWLKNIAPTIKKAVIR